MCEWNGEGLPPIGAEARAIRTNSCEEVVLIKARFGSQIWFATQRGEDVVCMLENVQFLPLLTEEERAVEEMIGIINAQLGIYDSAEMIAETLYQAGYRKQ